MTIGMSVKSALGAVEFRRCYYIGRGVAMRLTRFRYASGATEAIAICGLTPTRNHNHLSR